MTRPIRTAVAALMLAAVAMAGCGDASPAAEAEGTLRVEAATVEVPANPEQAALRFVVDNGTGRADRLEAVATDRAASATVHRSEVDDAGRATMTEVASLALPARSKVTFAPGGLHVMLEGLVAPLEVGDTFEVTVTFAEAGTHTVTAEVIAPGTTPGGPAEGSADDTEHDDHAS
ncbi:MAG TPA: copper chaperone PCu(A)C [Aquihabitans sp.]|jgi:hypothetical protein|nr:copper chaperone PCu(A)C [Aquihabitans sp.]